MFPLKALRRPKSPPYVTYTLIAINALVFAWELTLSQTELRQAYLTMSLIPCEVNLITLDTWLDLIRSMFLHGGWLHLIGNMVFLYIFGPNLEDYLGKRNYVVFYLLAGIAASLLHTVFNWNVCIPSIGASGAIYGLMGGFFLLYPATRIRSVAFLLRIPVGTVDVQAFYMLFYYFLIDFINGIASLGVENTATSGVAFWAHVGGFVAGLVMAFIVTIFKPAPPVDPLAYLDD